MAGDVIDFMKLWTQGDPASERFLRNFLLMGLDKVVQGQSDVLSKIPVGRPVSSPVVRWLEEWGYPSQLTAQLSGTSMTFSGYLFGKAITPESVKKVIHAGTILERPSDGVQAKVVSVNDLTATVAAYRRHGPNR